MKSFLSEDLKSLIDRRPETSVSIYLPMHRSGGDVQQDPIRLKNQLADAERTLISRGQKPADARRWLGEAHKLLDNDLFWRQHCSGLAVFVAENFFKYYRLPTSVEPLTIVGDRFHIKPVLRLFSQDARFAILALSLNSVRLYDATQFSVREIALENVPEGLADSIPPHAHEHQLLVHTEGPKSGGSQGSVYYGAGSGTHDNSENILRYFRLVDKAIHDQLNGKRIPLVLAGVDYLLPLYREITSHFPLMEHGVVGNPEGLAEETLRDKAWNIVAPYFQRGRERAAKAYSDLDVKGRTSSVRDAVVAALQGRIDTLFVPDGAHVWGKVDASKVTVEVHGEREEQDQDLLDFATIMTILKNGAAYVVGPGHVPGGGPVAAVYRY